MSLADIRFVWLFRATVLFAASATPAAFLITAFGIAVPTAAWICAAVLSISAILAAIGDVLALQNAMIAIRSLQWPSTVKLERKPNSPD